MGILLGGGGGGILTYLPYFSVACYTNTTTTNLGLIMVLWDSPMITSSNWEPAGHYYTFQLYCIQNQKDIIALDFVQAPFWFSIEHRWMVTTSFWISIDDLIFFNAHIPQNNCAPLIVLWKTLSDLQTLPHYSLASLLVFACFFYFLYPTLPTFLVCCASPLHVAYCRLPLYGCVPVFGAGKLRMSRWYGIV